MALLGPNGSGKTTFVMHLNGLLEGEGAVEVCGLPVEKRNLAAIRRKVGIVFQDSESQLFMPTVLEDVAFGPLNLGMSRERAEEVARAALETVGMGAAAGRPPYHLSAGEKKKVAIAGYWPWNRRFWCWMSPPPFSPPGQRALAGLLNHLPQAKILVTHDVPFAQSMCGRAVFFQNGAIAGQGPVEEIVVRFGWDFALGWSKSRP